MDVYLSSSYWIWRVSTKALAIKDHSYFTLNISSFLTISLLSLDYDLLVQQAPVPKPSETCGALTGGGAFPGYLH